MKRSLVSGYVKHYIACMYGVAFNPHATYSRTRLRRQRIGEAMTLAYSLAGAGYPVGAIVEEAFRGGA
ncbi:hypothetical protein ACB274_06335 [Aeromonas sanarellii]